MSLLAIAAAWGEMVTIERGGTLVSGRPFFPFGLFCVGWMAEDSAAALADAARLGCNTVQSYWAADVARSPRVVRDYLDEAERLDLKVLVTVGDYRTPRQAVTSGDRAPLQQAVGRMLEPVKDHPAVLAWYVWDEPNAPAYRAAPLVVRAASEAVKAADRSHPTAFCFTPWHQLETIGSYGECSDVLLVDPYVSGAYMGLVPEAVDKARQAAGPQRAVWAIIWAAQNAGSEPPTVAATRDATYLALIHGATGIFYYGHKGEPGKQGPSAGHESEGWQRGVGEPELHYLAEAIAQLSAEVHYLAPGLLAEPPSAEAVVQPRGSLDTRLIALGSRMVLLAANRGQKTVAATFRLPAGKPANHVRVLFSSRRLSVRGGKFSDRFAALDTRAYEWSD